MTYRDALLQLAHHTEAKAVAQYDQLGEDDALATVTATVARADRMARSLALLGYATHAMSALHRAVATPVLPVVDDTDRLTKATATAFATAQDSPDPHAIVGRLARSEPLGTAAETYSQALSYDPNVRGWIRAVNPGACELCIWWARGGKVYKPDTPFEYHPSCSCIQVPVFKSVLPGSDSVQLDPKFVRRSKVYDNPDAFKVSAEDEAAWKEFEKTLLREGH